MTTTPTQHTGHEAGHVLLLTPEAAAQALGISRTAIYRLMKSGEIDSLKIGRSRRISSESLYGFISRAVAGENRHGLSSDSYSHDSGQ
jgi:excisionase family DNA binding protein